MPVCRQCGSVGTSKGWQSRARRIYGANGDIMYLLSWEYYCPIGTRSKGKHCQQTFLASNRDSLRQLPFWVRNQFPFYLTHKAGAHRDLIFEILQEGERGHGPAVIASKLREKAYHRYASLETAFYSLASYLKTKEELKEDTVGQMGTRKDSFSFSRLANPATADTKVPRFPPFRDRQTFHGAHPSSRFKPFENIRLNRF